MKDIATALLLFLGGSFMLVAAIGMVRLPDLYTRLSASTKGATLGVSLTIIAVISHFGELSVTVQAMLTILFVLLTAPVSSHMIGRAAYFVGVPLWKATHTDELRGMYHRDTHELDSASKEASQGKGKPAPPPASPPRLR